MTLIEKEPIMKFIQDGINNKHYGHVGVEIITEVEYAPIIDAVPAWIDVNDRLPERHGQQCVGLYNQHGADKSLLFPHVFTWHAFGDNGYVNGPHFSGEGLDGLKVHYWMPLPEMPKEKTGD